MSMIIGATAGGKKTSSIPPPAVIRSHAAGTLSSTNQNNLTLTMPPSWVTGDMLIAFVAKNLTLVIDTAVSGVNWVTEYNSGTTNVGLLIVQKIAEGNSGDGLDALRVTSSTSGRWAGRVYAVQNALVVRKQIGIAAPGVIDPPALTLPATAQGYTFFSGASQAGGIQTGPSTGYGNLFGNEGGGSGSGGILAVQDKFELKGTSEDPSALAPSNNTNNARFTIALAGS